MRTSAQKKKKKMLLHTLVIPTLQHVGRRVLYHMDWRGKKECIQRSLVGQHSMSKALLKGSKEKCSWTLMNNLRYLVFVLNRWEMWPCRSPITNTARGLSVKGTWNPNREHMQQMSVMHKLKALTSNKAHLCQLRQNHMRPKALHLAKQYVNPH